MPTEGERLAVLEQRVAQMWEWINGGPSTRYEDSARGRLHKIVTTLATEDQLAQALREARRERAHTWSVWEKTGLFLCAFVTALSAVIGALAALGVL